MLRLVHPAREGQDPPRRKGTRSPALSLSAEEVRHLRAAIVNTARAYGGMEVLASVTGVSLNVLHSAAYLRSYRASHALAFVVARAAGMTAEAILGGKLSPAGRCKACGARVAE